MNNVNELIGRPFRGTIDDILKNNFSITDDSVWTCNQFSNAFSNEIKKLGDGHAPQNHGYTWNYRCANSAHFPQMEQNGFETTVKSIPITNPTGNDDIRIWEIGHHIDKLKNSLLKLFNDIF